MKTGGNESHSAPATFLKLIPSNEEAQYIFPSLLNIPTPRSIQWDWRIRLGAALLISFGALIGISLITTTKVSGNAFSSLMRIAVIVAIVLLFLLPSLSNRTLFRNGDVAVGRVVYQQTTSGSRRHTWSVIFYAFVDRGNRGFIGQGTDLTESLAEGAPVLVYYDQLNPYKNVAMECSRLRVKQG